MNFSNFTANISGDSLFAQCQQALSDCSKVAYDNMLHHRYEIVVIVLIFTFLFKILLVWFVEERYSKNKISEKTFQYIVQAIRNYEKYLLLPIWFIIAVLIGIL